MRTYQINAWVSENGTISLPNMPDLYNKEVQLVITLEETETKEMETEMKEAKNEEYQPISEFGKLCHSLRNCRPSKEEEEAETLVDKLRYEYLMEKYK
jgi:hypothetical protein